MDETKFEGVEKSVLDRILGAGDVQCAKLNKVARQLVEVAAEHELSLSDFIYALRGAEKIVQRYGDDITRRRMRGGAQAPSSV